MSAGRELEAKFYCPDLNSLRQRVLAQGGQEVSPRAFERNLHFDTPDGRLKETHQVLRLRQERETSLTYKRSLNTIEAREELELALEDFETGRALLEAIGFEVVFIYEKYRQTLALGPAHIMLDELPYGHFAEVEGPSLEDIRAICAQLDLDWSQRLAANYQDLFQHLVQARGLSLRDATFKDLGALPSASAQELEGSHQSHSGREVI